MKLNSEVVFKLMAASFGIGLGLGFISMVLAAFGSMAGFIFLMGMIPFVALGTLLAPIALVLHLINAQRHPEDRKPLSLPGKILLYGPVVVAILIGLIYALDSQGII